VEDDNQLPPWLGNPALNTGDDEETSPTIGMRIGARPGMYAPPPAATAPPPMPPVPFDPSKIPASIRPQPQSPSSGPVSPTGRPKLTAVPGVYGLSAARCFRRNYPLCAGRTPSAEPLFLCPIADRPFPWLPDMICDLWEQESRLPPLLCQNQPNPNPTPSTFGITQA
jgi:hypothetical protein